MRTHVDWITFSVENVYPEFTPDDPYGGSLERGLLMLLGEPLVRLAFNGEWELRERSRAPYKHAWALKDSGITVFAAPALPHFCVEISGEGCERLIALKALQMTLERVSERVTRIDVASDIETEVSPQEFVSEVKHERMRANGYQNSESGQTCYVGSQKSERYARIYRYSHPHPRAHLLRVEHVFRREYAKAVAARICDTSQDAVANAAADAFGWAHRVWDTGVAELADITVVAPERKMGKTVFWMVDTVAATFKRLVREGIIKDPEEFLYRYFLSDT